MSPKDGRGRQRCLSEDELSLIAHRLMDEGSSRVEHSGNCPKCRGRLDELQRVLALARPPTLEDPGAGFNREIWRRIDRTRTRQRAGLAVISTLSAAAVALLVLLPRGVHVPDEAEMVEKLDFYQQMDVIEYLDVLESVDALLDGGVDG